MQIKQTQLGFHQSLKNLLWLIGVSNLLLLFIARFIAPLFVNVPLCLFHLLTGLPCPFCGMTRSYMAISQFELHAAIGHNSMALVFVVVGLFALLHNLVNVVFPRLYLRSAYWRIIAKLVGVGLLVNWVYMLVLK